MRTDIPVGKHIAIILLSIVVAISVVTLLVRLSHPPREDWQALPLPDISAQPLSLRVVYARNTRFPELDDALFQPVLDHTRVLVKQHFDVDVMFETQKPVYVEHLFSYLPKAVRKARQSDILDPRALTQQDRDHMRNLMKSRLQASGVEVQDLIDYASPYLVDNQNVQDLDGLSQALMDTLVARMRYWYEDKAADGRPVIDGTPFNEWVWWDSLGYGKLPYDVVLTNQLVASLESYDIAMHTALRGGINGGTMTNSKAGRYGGYIFVSVFPLLNDTAMIAGLRDEMHYTDEQIVQFAAATLAHEIGHLLFHYDHPFGDRECLMNPTPLLRYRSWYEGLDAGACKARNLPQMQPGAARIEYNTAW